MRKMLAFVGENGFSFNFYVRKNNEIYCFILIPNENLKTHNLINKSKDKKGKNK